MRTFCAVLGGFSAPFCTIFCIMSLHSLRFYAILCTLGSSNICRLSCGSKSFSSLPLPEFFFLPLTLCRAGGFFIPHHKLPCDSIPNGSFWHLPSQRHRLQPLQVGKAAHQRRSIKLRQASNHTLRAPPPPPPPLDTRRGRESPSAMSEAKRRLWRAER